MSKSELVEIAGMKKPQPIFRVIVNFMIIGRWLYVIKGQKGKAIPVISCGDQQG
jgi:hypothetical protein